MRMNPKIDHRTRWLAKLAYPEIDTQRTAFSFVSGLTVKLAIPRLVAIADPLAVVVEGAWSEEKLDLRWFCAVGRRTQRVSRIALAYSRKLDTCVIYKSIPAIESEIRAEIEHHIDIDRYLRADAEL